MFPKLDLTSLPAGNLHHLRLCRFIHNQNRRRRRRRHRHSAYLSHAVLACSDVIPEHSGAVPTRGSLVVLGTRFNLHIRTYTTQTTQTKPHFQGRPHVHSPIFSHPPTCRSSNRMHPKASVAVLYPTRKSALSSPVKGSLTSLCSPIGSPLVVHNCKKQGPRLPSAPYSKSYGLIHHLSYECANSRCTTRNARWPDSIHMKAVSCSRSDLGVAGQNGLHRSQDTFSILS